jgi:hypothetical protein
MSEFVEVRPWPTGDFETEGRRAILDWMGRKSKYHMPAGTFYERSLAPTKQRHEIKLTIGNRTAVTGCWIGKRHDGTFGVIYDHELLLFKGLKFHYEHKSPQEDAPNERSD